MDPVTLAILGGGAISAISGISQFLSSKEAQNANQKQLNELKKLASQLQDPDFDMSEIPAPQLKVLQQFSPVIASYVPEKSPELVKAMSSGAKQGRAAQLDALEQYKGVATSGTDPLLEMAQAKALRDASSASGSAIATANQNMAQRGMAPGGGLGYAAQLSQAAGSQSALANVGMANAADQYNRRMAAMGNAAQLGGAIRGEDVAQEQGNANALNDYNRRISEMGNNYNQYVSGLQNQANQYNMEKAQSVYDGNIMNRYNAKVGTRDYLNNQKQNIYANKLGKLNTQFGLGNSQTNLNNNQAKLTNQGLQGLTDGINTGIMGYANRQDTLAERAKKEVKN